MQKLPFQSFVVASDDDPRVSAERAAFFAGRWGATIHRPGAFGHLGNAADLGEWAYGAAFARAIAAERARYDGIQ